MMATILRTRAKQVRNLLARKVGRIPLGGLLLGSPVTDQVQARMALYDFLAAFVVDAKVVDLTPGSGFAAEYLARHGHPAELLSVHTRPGAESWARRYHSTERMRFLTTPQPESVLRDDTPRDVIVVSDASSFQNLPGLIATARQRLGAKGKLMIAASPMRGPERDHASVTEAAKMWRRELLSHFAVANAYAEYPPEGASLSLNGTAPTTLDFRQFRFAQLDPEQEPAALPLLVIYMATEDERFARPRLHVGCGPLLLPDWINVDNQSYPGIEFLWDASRGLPFIDASYVFAEHFIEHLPYDAAVQFLTECRRVLGQDGIVRLSTPNLDWVMKACYRQEFWTTEEEAVYDCMAANRGFRGWGHHYLYNLQALTALLRSAGFARVEALAYGQSSDPVLRGLERHPPSPDAPGLPHVLVVEASGRAPATPLYESIMNEYRRDIAVV